MEDIRSRKDTPDGTGAIVLPKTAVLPGKPNPLDYGAVKKGAGFWWPKGDKFGRILVHGVWLPRAAQMAKYKAALAAWSQKSSAYSVRVSAMGPDRALRSSLRAQSARSAALENRIATLEQQLAESSIEPMPWAEDGAYYYADQSFDPGGFFDDEGFYGEFDGMSGADGDLGLVRRYGEHVEDYILMGADDDDGVSGEDQVEGLDDLDGTDDLEGEEQVDGLDDDGAGDLGAPQSRAMTMARQQQAGGPQSRAMTMARQQQAKAQAKAQANAQANAQAKGRVPVRPPAGKDRSDLIISNLRKQIGRGKVDVNALVMSLNQAGIIVGTEIRKKENQIERMRLADGLAGQLPPPPPPPPSLDGVSDPRFSIVQANDGLGGLPPPPPPPDDGDLGADCGCPGGPPPGDPG